MFPTSLLATWDQCKWLGMGSPQFFSKQTDRGPERRRVCACQSSLFKVGGDRRNRPTSQLAVGGERVFTLVGRHHCGSEPTSSTQLHVQHSLTTSWLSDSRQVSLNLLMSLDFHVCKVGKNSIYFAKFLSVIKSTQYGLLVTDNSNSHKHLLKAYPTG